MTTQAEVPTQSKVDSSLIDRFTLKAFVEACLVVEERIAGVRDVDLGMMMGTGMIPGPFARADGLGLDVVLDKLEKAETQWGKHFEPPLILRRMVAQGRLGVKSGQGFYPYPQPESGYETAKVKLDVRGPIAIVWLDNPPANSLSPDVINELAAVWQKIDLDSNIRAMIIASPNPALFCAGADIKSFTRMASEEGVELLNDTHALLRSWEHSSTMTIAAINGLAYGGGCEISMACDVRIASESSTFAQPEVNLGIIPGFGGTQRLKRLVGYSKALEMNTTGDTISADDAYEHGLVNRVVADHELFDAAVSWASNFAKKPPISLAKTKQAMSLDADIETGIEVEKQAFYAAFSSEDAREGIDAFVNKRTPHFRGK